MLKTTALHNQRRRDREHSCGERTEGLNVPRFCVRVVVWMHRDTFCAAQLSATMDPPRTVRRFLRKHAAWSLWGCEKRSTFDPTGPAPGLHTTVVLLYYDIDILSVVPRTCCSTQNRRLVVFAGSPKHNEARRRIHLYGQCLQ